MRILYLGDIMGEPGVEVVEEQLPSIREKYNINLVIAQSENVSGGRSMLPIDMRRLQRAGVDVFSGGNHTPERKEIHRLLRDKDQPVIGPANMVLCPGDGYFLAHFGKESCLVVSMLGTIFLEHPPAIENPLQTIDLILKKTALLNPTFTIINIHSDYSSEKRVFGYYLDGKVTAVIGDHWHIPSADAAILPKGTAHITDVGMCGAKHSSLGVKTERIIDRWRDGAKTKNELEARRPYQLCSVLITANKQTGRASSIKQLIFEAK